MSWATLWAIFIYTNSSGHPVSVSCHRYENSSLYVCKNFRIQRQQPVRTWFLLDPPKALLFTQKYVLFTQKPVQREIDTSNAAQACQIFLGKNYQTGKNTK
jgi:hypothetical protein